jgi:hypothetical protein
MGDGMSTLLEWQSIETAPRDGTPVVLFVPNFDRKVHLGYFVDAEDFRYGKSVSKRAYWAIGVVSFMRDEAEPTHWLPLPSDPVAL